MRDAFKKFMGDEVENQTNEPITTEERRVLGKIIKVSEDGGWGFISSKEIKFTRIFFHWTSLRQDTLNFSELKHGMHVEFTPVDGGKEKGWRAIKIRVVNKDGSIITPELS